MEINRILVIADRKDNHTTFALKRAVSLIRDPKKGEIHLVAFVFESFVESEKMLSKEERGKYREQIVQRRTADLQALLKNTKLDKVKVKLEVVWQKDIHTWIADQSRKSDFDLIIKTGNRSESLWYTPTDWKMMRECMTPTYIVARKAWKKQAVVLATLDFDSRSRAQQKLNRDVLQEAALIAQLTGTQLHICHVIAVSQVLSDMDLVDPKRLKRNFNEKSLPKLVALAKEYGVAEDAVHVSTGAPNREIPRLANRLKAELGVMGGFGRKGAASVMLGNTAERVISVLRTDILVVRSRS